MRTRERIVSEIHRFLARSGHSPRWLGMKVTGDGRLVYRIERGENVGLTIIERIEAVMNGTEPTPLRVRSKP